MKNAFNLSFFISISNSTRDVNVASSLSPRSAAKKTEKLNENYEGMK